MLHTNILWETLKNSTLKVTNKSYKNVEKFKYLEMRVIINQNYFHKDINYILNMENACLCLLPKNVNKYKIIILPVVCVCM
jgi:hypothetical protein